MYNNVNLNSHKNTTDKNGVIRFDFIFSYWIFFWFLIYYFVLLTSSKNMSKFATFILHYNPFIGLIFAFLENIVLFIYMLPFFQTEILIKYVFMMFLIKIIPIYLIRNQKINPVNDIFAIIVLFCIYLLWLYYNKTDVIDVYKKTTLSITLNSNKTPLFHFIDYTIHSLFGNK